MSTSINVHPSTDTEARKAEGVVTLSVKLGSWPRNLSLGYEQGGPGIEGNHSTCIFIGALSANAIRELAGDATAVSEKLFEYANHLDEHGNDGQEG